MTTSLWHDRNQPTARPAATLEGHADVVVVGGGLTGVTTALLLSRAGLSVVVVEARRLGAGTTGGSTAKVSLLQGTRLSSIARLHDDEVVRRYVEGNREAQAWVSRFCADHDVVVQTRDAVTFAQTDAGAQQVAAEQEVAQRAGLDVVRDDDLGLPFPVSSAIRLGDQLQLDPLELLGALARQAEEHGAAIVEGTRVQSVRGRSPVQVGSDNGTMTADHVVVATGMPILDRGAFFARMSPARSYGLAFSTPTQSVDAMYLSADSPSRSLRDAPGPLLLVGGAGHPTGRQHPTSACLDELRGWTAQWYPGAVETHGWSAQDFVPTRQLPFAGPVLPGADHVLVAGGYAKWGMTNAVAAALATTARLTGGSMPWASVLDTWQRDELRSTPDLVKVNLEVGLELGKGWLRTLTPGGDRTPSERETDLSGVCTHLGGVVSWNDAERSWDCPLHGSRYDEDGAVLEGPATCGLRVR